MRVLRVNPPFQSMRQIPWGTDCLTHRGPPSPLQCLHQDSTFSSASSKRVCEKSRSSWLESFEHEMDHGYINPSLAGFRQGFIVFAQAPAAAQPRQRPLHHPPAGQHLKGVTVRPPPDHAQQPTASDPGPGYQLASVCPVSPDHFEPGKPAHHFAQHQLGPGLECWRHVPPRPGAVLKYLLRCDACAQQPSCRHRSLWAPFFRGLHRLAVDDRGAGRSLVSLSLPNPGTQSRLNALPGPISALPKIPPNRPPGRQVMGRHAPGYAAAQHI